MTRCRGRFAPIDPDRIVVLLVVLYATLLSLLSILQYQTFGRLTRDLGLYQQLLWNALQGRFFTGTMVETLMGSQNALADHFSPGLLLLLPVFALWPDPRLLLVIQSVAYGLAAVPIYLFGRERLPSRWLAVLIAGLYLLQPALHHANLFEFHEISLAVPLIALAVWLVHRYPRRIWLLIVVLLLAMTIKEDVPLTVAALGLYLAVWLRRWRVGLGIVVLGLAWAVTVIGFVMPALNTYNQSFIYVSQYAGLGNTPDEIVWTALTHPELVIPRLLVPQKLIFLLDLLLPFGFLPLLGLPVLFVAAPTFGYLTLSDDPVFATIYYHHAAPIVPILAFATIDGLARIFHLERLRGSLVLSRSLRRFLPLWLGLTLAVGLYVEEWGPFSGNLRLSRFRVDDRAAFTRQFLEQIPPGAAVSASGNLIAQLASREWIKEFPAFEGADHVVLDFRGIDPADPKQVGAARWNAQRKLWQDPLWQLQDARDGLVLLRREREPGALPSFRRRLGLVFGEEIELKGYRLPPGRSVPPGGELQVQLFWQGLRPIQTSYLTSVQLVDGEGRRFWQGDTAAWGGTYPTTQWTPGREFRDVRYVRVPPEVPAGAYRLLLAVYPSGDAKPLAVRGIGPVPYGRHVLLGPVAVGPAHEPLEWAGEWRSIGAIFDGGKITLRRAWLDRPKTRAGRWLNLATEWEARQPLKENYTLFVHLRDDRNRIWGQQDEQPGWGYRATGTWQLDEPVEQVTALRVRPDTPAGRYFLDAGLYQLDTGRRLPIGLAGKVITQVTVAEVEVVE